MSGHPGLRVAACAAAAFLAGGAVAATTTTYHVVSLGGTDAQAAGMNSGGKVAGSVGFVPALLDHGTITMLGSDPGNAVAVNSKSNATGTSYADGLVRAFSWRSSAMKEIGPMFGDGNATHGVAINSNGDVLCVEYGASQSTSFVFSGGTKTQVNGPAGYGYVLGAAINDAGDIAGAATPPNKLAHAFVRIAKHSTDLGAFGTGATYSAATAININDVVAGDSASVPGNTTDVTAFRWSNNVMTNLGALSPSTRSHALAIDNKGNVVGYSYADFHNSVPHAFYYDGTKMTDLNKHLDAASAAWVLETATGIDDAGAITGMGVFGGDRLPYLATPVK